MQFKDFYHEQQILGSTEYVEIAGVGRVAAKVDSGNDGYNVLHASNIELFDQNKVRFRTADNKTVSKPVVATIDVVAGGHNQKRYVVEFDIKIGTQFFRRVKFSLADRLANEEKVLLGAPFLKQLNALVDVSKKQLIERVSAGKHNLSN